MHARSEWGGGKGRKNGLAKLARFSKCTLEFVLTTRLPFRMSLLMLLDHGGRARVLI